MGGGGNLSPLFICPGYLIQGGTCIPHRVISRLSSCEQPMKHVDIDKIDEKLLEAIRSRAVDVALPSGSTQKTLDLGATRAIAEGHGVSLREVETAALASGIVPRRYLRNLGALGKEGQIALLRSAVAIIGIGGLGGTIALNLARVGVGRLCLVDGDVFSEDNLNRQEFCSEDAIGRPKVQVAAERIRAINSAVEVTTIYRNVGTDDLVELLAGCDAAVDALDNIPSRFALSDAATRLRIPLVHGSVAGFVGQVSSIAPGDAGFTAIFGDRESLPEKGVEVTLGNLPGVVGAIANIQTVEVIKLLIGKGELLSNRLLFIDFEGIVFDIFSL